MNTTYMNQGIKLILYQALNKRQHNANKVGSDSQQVARRCGVRLT
jgi:hypothetical protein